MTTKYCDHDSYAAYAATPTWGVPQDGDGLAKSPSSAASVASIDLTSYTSTAGTFGLFGSTAISVGASASGATLATQIAAAINASAVVTGDAACFPNNPQIRDLFFAKAVGAVLSIMCRHGSSLTNKLGLVWAGTWSAGPPSGLTFSGGVSGCFGYFINAGTVWASGTYTLMKYGVLALNAPLVGGISAGDLIHIRSNKTITCTGLAYTSTESLKNSTVENPVVIKIDDSTEWSDGIDPVLTVALRVTSGDYCWVNFSRPIVLEARRYATGVHSLFFDLNTTKAATLSFEVNGYRTASRFTGVSAIQQTTPAAVLQFSYSAGGPSGYDSSKESFMFKDCYFQSNTPNYHVHSSGTAYFNFEAMFDSCTFSNAGNSSASYGVLGVNTQSSRTKLTFNSCKFNDFVAGSRLHINSIDNRASYSVTFKNTDFGNVSKKGPNTALANRIERSIVSASQYGSRDFHIETMHGFVEWNSTLGFPVCNATLLDGITGWSIHIVPTTVADNNNAYVFAETPRISKINSLPDGVRTLTVELAIHELLAFNKSHISAVLCYMGTDGKMQVIDTHDILGAALDVSTATWSSEVGGQVTFVDGSTQYHDKYKFSVTTPTPIATGTEISVFVRCHTHVADTTKGFFIDPEIVVV